VVSGGGNGCEMMVVVMMTEPVTGRYVGPGMMRRKVIIDPGLHHYRHRLHCDTGKENGWFCDGRCEG
jgi:hypothetical protein